MKIRQKLKVKGRFRVEGKIKGTWAFLVGTRICTSLEEPTRAHRGGLRFLHN